MVECSLKTFGVPPVRGEEEYVHRVLNMPVELSDYLELKKVVQYIGVTEEFKEVLKTFPMEEGTPAGFRRELVLDADGVLKVDLVRDISYDKNGILRPTKVLYSADSANPYEVAPVSSLISNLTCNPGIIYDLFLNNPKANVGGAFKTRDEVMTEISRILGPGCDISVELNNPFEKDYSAILEEAEKFKEIFSKYRVVIKVPHTGVVTPDNVGELLTGSGRLSKRYDDVDTKEALRAHNLALRLHEDGFKVNFTLMFEPYQTQMALQARPYFINSFIRHRLIQSKKMKQFIDMYEAAGDTMSLELLKDYMISTDYLTEADAAMSYQDVYKRAKNIVEYRQIGEDAGKDGLDGMRHNLRLLKNANLKDTRLIVCSMEGPENYPDIDRLLTEPEFADMNHKIVVTAEPNYLARFTSTNQVISYQRRFMKAAQGQK